MFLDKNLSMRARIAIPSCVIILLLLVPLYISHVYVIHLLVFILFNIILALSLRFIMLTGSLYLGHTAFMGIGGYVTVLSVMKLGLPCEVALLAAALIGIIVAAVLGVIILRLRGVYFIIVSIALVEVIRLIATNWEPVTGGTAGIHVSKPIILGLSITSTAHYYWFVAILALLVFFTLYRLERSRVGMILKSIAQAEDLARAIGVNTTKYKVIAFAVGSAIASICGGFFAFYMQFMAPQYVSFLTAVYILIYCIIGGLGNIWGPIIGASVMTLLSEPLRGMTYYEMLTYGVILIIIVIASPEGLVTLPSKISGIIGRVSPRARATRRLALEQLASEQDTNKEGR